MDTFRQHYGLSEESVKLLLLIGKIGPCTKETMMNFTGDNRTTLNRFLTPLLQCGAVVERGEEESNGGRKPIIFDVNTEDFCLCGIDLSWYAVRIGFFDLHLHSLGFREAFFIEDGVTPGEVCRRLAEMYKIFMNQRGIRQENIISIGVSVAGPYWQREDLLRPIGGKFAPLWVNVPIRAMLEEALCHQVYVDEGANAMAWYQYAYNNPEGYQNVADVGFGVVIRSGVIYDGRIIRAVNENWDALAHMVIQENGRYCECGKQGCLLRYASIHRIISDFKLLSKSSYPEYDTPEMLKYVCQQADRGESAAVEAITSAAKHFTTGLINLIQIFGIEKIGIGGAPVYYGELFFKTCADILARHELKSLKCVFRDTEEEWFLAVGAAAIGLSSIVKGIV